VNHRTPLFHVARNKNHVPDEQQIEKLPWGSGKVRTVEQKALVCARMEHAPCTLPVETKLLCSEAVEPTRESRKPLAKACGRCHLCHPCTPLVFFLLGQ
jgi:hypothetical protein